MGNPVSAICYTMSPALECPELDAFVKSPKIPFSVIPAKAGIQSFPAVADHLDSGFHRSDDFLRFHQTSLIPFFKDETAVHITESEACLRNNP